jgi:hypothetical protein
MKMMFADCVTRHTFNQSNTIEISLRLSGRSKKKSGFKERSRVMRSAEGSQEATHSNAGEPR